MKLKQKIVQIYSNSRTTYSSPHIHQKLVLEGYRILAKAGRKITFISQLLQSRGSGKHKNTIAYVAQNCNIIITMLPNSPDVQKAVLGEEGILK